MRQRQYGLDALRGMAALAVVVYHWRMMAPGMYLPQGKAPGYWPLFWGYECGMLAVSLFFMLSGYLFYRLYADAVYYRRIGVARFAVLRFARLYPLHLVTLLAVAGLQLWFMGIVGGREFGYRNTDWYHFLVNLFLLHGTGMERGTSFNGPAWSIGVEVVCYALFFGVARLCHTDWRAMLVCAVAGHWSGPYLTPNLATGIEGFFMGGLVYKAASAIEASGLRDRLTGWLADKTAVLWLVVLAVPFWGLQMPRQANATWYWLYLVFPLTLLAVAVNEAALRGVSKRLAWLGDLSYSLYLWHFPVMFGMLMVVLKAYPDFLLVMAQHKWFFGLYLTLLFGVAWVSRRYIEVPLQRWIRGESK